MLMDEVLMMRLFGVQLWVMFRVGGTLCLMFLDLPFCSKRRMQMRK